MRCETRDVADKVCQGQPDAGRLRLTHLLHLASPSVEDELRCLLRQIWPSETNRCRSGGVAGRIGLAIAIAAQLPDYVRVRHDPLNPGLGRGKQFFILRAEQS